MAQVPVNTATVETAKPLTDFLLAGSRKSDRIRTEKASNKDGRTFADALKTAAGGKSRSVKGEISIRKEKPENGKPEAGRAVKLKTGQGTSKRAPQDAEKQPRNNGIESLPVTPASAGRPANILAAVQNTLSAAPDNQHSRVESGKRNSATQNLKGFQPDSGGTAPVSAHIKGANLSDGAAGLTSSARRVEVVDLKKTASDSKSEFRDRINARKEAGRMESGVKGNQAADPGKGDSRFAVVETEIGVPGRISGPGDGRTAAAELSRRLDAEAGNEIVRQVKVVLTRADAGEIRINLRPENLGRVRVEIHLDDNRLTGRIFVDSAAAREAFRNSLDGLQTRLVESGFGAADLELAWEGNSGTFAGFGGSSSKNGKQVHLAVREFENMAGSVIQDVLADGLVNMVV